MRIFVLTLLLVFNTSLAFTNEGINTHVSSSDRDRAEQTFKSEIARATIHLQTIYSQGLLTEDELAQGIQLAQDYQQQTLLYLQSLLELKEEPDEDSYVYALEYNAGLLNMLVMNPNARIDEYTPEVMDFVPARDLCSELTQSQDLCVEQMIQVRQDEIFSAIEERHHQNQNDFFAAARVGLTRGHTYAQLIGIIHHQSQNLRHAEVLDVTDRMVGSTNQDLNEGY